MTPQNKKIMLYALGALAVGGTIFFAASYFKKTEIAIGSDNVSLGDDNLEGGDNSEGPDSGPTSGNFFSNLLISEKTKDLLDFNIKVPNLASKYK